MYAEEPYLDENDNGEYDEGETFVNWAPDELDTWNDGFYHYNVMYIDQYCASDTKSLIIYIDEENFAPIIYNDENGNNFYEEGEEGTSLFDQSINENTEANFLINIYDGDDHPYPSDSLTINWTLCNCESINDNLLCFEYQDQLSCEADTDAQPAQKTVWTDGDVV